MNGSPVTERGRTHMSPRTPGTTRPALYIGARLGNTSTAAARLLPLDFEPVVRDRDA